jgi:hypothetical protein
MSTEENSGTGGDPNFNPQTQFRPSTTTVGDKGHQDMPAVDTNYSNQYTIEEMIDVVQGELTVSCALPKLLPDDEIRRIICNDALGFFYQDYLYAVQKTYFFCHKDAFKSDDWTKHSHIKLPEAIQTISYVYPIRDASLFSIGINAPNLSVNMGVTNQPYVSSYVTTIGELGVYKTILDSFSDMMDQLSKHTVKYHFSAMMHEMQVLTSLETHLIIEGYANVPQEALFADPLFIRYVTGQAKRQLGNMLGRYNFNLPGGIQYNHGDLSSEGKEDIEYVREKIKGMSNSAFMFLVKR